MTDNATLLTRAIDQTNTLVAAIPGDRAHSPTPCPEFDVADLVDHVTIIANRAAHAIDPQWAPSSSWHAAYSQLRAGLSRPIAQRMVDLPFGSMPLPAALGVFVGEFVTHSWDLATAIGSAHLLDDDLGEQALAMVTARIPATGRDRTPFGDVVPVSPDAPVYDRLAGWMGRNPA